MLNSSFAVYKKKSIESVKQPKPTSFSVTFFRKYKGNSKIIKKKMIELDTSKKGNKLMKAKSLPSHLEGNCACSSQTNLMTQSLTWLG